MKTFRLRAAAPALAAVVALSLLGGAQAEENRWSEHESGWEAWDSGACMHCRLARLGSLPGESSPELRYELGTGRDLRNYAPDRPADIKHMRLEIDIPNMNTPRLTARQTLTLVPIARPLETLDLNAEQMEITRVSAGPAKNGSESAPFSYNDRVLTVRFEPPLPAGKEASVVVEYALSDPPDGLFWTPESPAWPGRPAQIHTQGQPETNRYWFPCHDFPNERMTTELIVTVPEGFVVSSNGREANKAVTKNGRTTWHWLQDKEHVAYLVTMVVGKFDIHDVAPKGFRTPLPVYVPPGLGGQIEQTYGRTARMIEVFEKRFSEPYPWDRYAQLLVWNFGAGGMENTSATSMYDTAVLDKKALLDGDLDGLISHELGHQWFGDLITCNTWAHIWLNEGWATYCSALWLEARDGWDPGYLDSMHRTMRGIARRDSISADASGNAASRPPMVSPVYREPFEAFRRTSNPYPKGCSILHMLRMRLGDELFFKCVGEYVDRYKFKTAETDDFRRVFEELSGQSLEQFFDQWARRPGTPKVRIRGSWSEREKKLKITLDQQQLVSADLPAFVFDLPIVIRSGGEDRTIKIAVDSSHHEQTVTLAAEPEWVAVDPTLTVLMQPTFEMPVKWLTAQLKGGPTAAAKLDAADALGARRGGDAGIKALKEVVLDSSANYRLRARCAESLGKLNAPDAILELDRAGVDDARVRREVIDSLGMIGGAEAVAALAVHAADVNESYACRAAALEALGKNGAGENAEHLSVLLDALQAESQHDQVRVGALRGLTNLDHKDGLDAVIPYTAQGHYNRTRPVAIAAVGKLGHYDKDKAFETLAPLALDREERARRAAGSALVELKDERGRDVLARAVDAARTRDERDIAIDRRSGLASALSKDDSIQSTRSEVERLKSDIKRLQNKVDKGSREDRPEGERGDQDR